MSREAIRVLLVADTHLGFDYPARPRVERRRRGPDFFRNFELALEPALRGEVDLVVHGGDLLFRSRVPSGLVARAFEPLREVVDAGVPVVVVPGNHERSRLPRPLVADHPLIQIFNRPSTARYEFRGQRVAVSGFPFDRQVRRRFGALLQATEARAEPADLNLLCVHQAVEGATVGPSGVKGSGFTFRDAADVIRGTDLPTGFAAVLTGHIHRHQVLTHDLTGRPLASPVLYPGSVERTSAAERHEEKGYLRLEFSTGAQEGGRLERWKFRPLPARPMHLVGLEVSGLTAAQLTAKIGQTLAGLPSDAVVSLRIEGEIGAPAWPALSAAALRSVTPATMNLTLQGIAPRGKKTLTDGTADQSGSRANRKPAKK